MGSMNQSSGDAKPAPVRGGRKPAPKPLGGTKPAAITIFEHGRRGRQVA